MSKKKLDGVEIDALRDSVIDDLMKMSVDQVDPHVLARLYQMKGRDSKEIQDELLGVLDDCAHGALASDFVMGVLDTLWKQAGGVLENHKDRLRPENFERLKGKYKWHRGTE